MIRDPEREKMARGELEKLQLQRLQIVAAQVYENVPFYRRTFRDSGVFPDDIRSLADLVKLPFTSKLDFRDNYPFGLTAAPPGTDRPHPFLQWHHGEAGHRAVHPG
jgi:phenylacetate-CoA ligase